MLPLQLAMAFLFCVSSFANSIIDQNELRHVMDELKLLRKEVEQNRKHILKQDGKLKAVKLELEEVKKHCRCEPNPSEEKSESEMNEVSSVNKTGISLSGGQSKIKRSTLQTSHDGPISFYAYMSSAMNHVGVHHTLIFNVIKSNKGQGLSRTTGVFRAPQSGFYVFTWTIRVLNYSIHCVQLIVNGQPVGALVSQSAIGENESDSTTVVVHVNQGEEVFLRTFSHYNKGSIYSDGYGYSSFAGWKLS